LNFQSLVARVGADRLPQQLVPRGPIDALKSLGRSVPMTHMPDRGAGDIEWLMRGWRCFSEHDNDNDNDNEWTRPTD
jgi:hypothetical protein